MLRSVRSRYHHLDTVEVGDRRSLALRPIPAPPDTAEIHVHILVGGDTLDQLAWVYYGREDLWWRIADANPDRFPLDFQPGDRLLIPPLSTVTRTPRR